MPLHQQRARNSIPPRRRRDRSRYPQTFQHNSELLVVRPAAAPTSLNDLEPFNLSTVLIDVHKDCYKSISQAQQGGRHRRKTLNLQSQTLHAAPHVGVAGRDPDPDAARYRDHRRLRTSRTRPNASASTFSSTLTRLPSPSSISITPWRFRAGIAAGASIDRTLSAAAGVS